MKIGQDDDPLLLDPTELRFQAKKRVALCDIVKDGLKIVRRKNGLVRSFQMCEVVVLGETKYGCFSGNKSRKY